MTMNPLKRSSTGEMRGVEQKCTVACAGCRSRKIRCNGGLPCPNCVDRSLDCYYPEAQRRGPRTNKNKSDSDFTSDSNPQSKVARTGSNSSPNSRANNRVIFVHNPAIESRESHKSVGEGTRHGSFSYIDLGASQTTAAEADPQMAVSMSDSTVQSDSGSQDSTKLLDCDASATPDGVEGISLGEVGCEYHGPGAMISICSKSAVTWICEKINNADFKKISAKFASDISRRLKLDRDLLREVEPEPPKQVAWAYCKAFFNSSSGSWFKMIHQASFEGLLASYFVDDKLKSRDEPSWYALRNMVYAIGCRSLLSKQTSSDCNEKQQQPGRYFFNALSVHTELLYSRTGLFSVQALTLMSVFAEGITCPSLDFMLCSDALRLAESKGLHRGSSSTCLQREIDIQAAGHLWWAIYTHHVMIVTRSGRSLQIDDDSITCTLPTQSAGESWAQYATRIGIVKHARMQSSVTRELNKIRRSQSMSNETFAIVQRLDGQLQEWRSSLPGFAQPDTPSEGGKLPKGVTFEQCLYLEYAHYATLIQIHSIVMCPWSKAYQEKPTTNPNHQSLIFESASIVAGASRKIIAQLRHIKITLETPKWAVLIYPMVALIHLFIFILEYPTLPSVDSDTSLIHEAAAHFNFLEYRIDSISLPFARDLANLLRELNSRHIACHSQVGSVIEENSMELEALVERPEYREVFDLGVLEIEDWDAFVPWDNMLQSLGDNT